MRVSGPLEVRFWAKVDKRGPDECWEWTASRHRYGYGRIGAEGSREILMTHRVSWELHFGPIPEGMEVCHRCDNGPCVNPKHLFLGTHADNMKDARDKGRVPPPPHYRGEQSHRAILTEQQVLEIRKRLNAGESEHALARSYGVSRSTIHSIRSRQNWSWLKEEE